MCRSKSIIPATVIISRNTLDIGPSAEQSTQNSVLTQRLRVSEDSRSAGEKNKTQKADSVDSLKIFFLLLSALN